MTAGSTLIIVFTKPALPGQVKTRLVPCLTPDEAAEFHLAATADVVAVAERTAKRVELHVAGDEDDAAELRALYPDREVRVQADGGLGERLIAAFDSAFRRDFERVLIVGSDHPTLPARHLCDALARLADCDAALGPSRDGGYYAVALRRGSWPAAQALFRFIPWSTPEVLAETRQRARDAGLRVALAPEWYDVDRPEDLQLVGRDGGPDSAAFRFLRFVWQRRGGCCAS
jgi:rSAM/selenodomain-associated transferase 1